MLSLTFTKALAVCLCAALTRAENCTTPYDLIFVLDGSGSIPGTQFEVQLQFVHDIIDSMDIGQDAEHVGVVQYSSDAVLEYELGFNKPGMLEKLCRGGNCKTCYRCSSVRTSIEQLQSWWDSGISPSLQCCADLDESCCCYENGACNTPQLFASTYPDTGLTIARDQFLAKERGVPKIVLMTTDGVFHTDPTYLDNLVSAMKTENVHFIAVGVGDAVTDAQLLGVSSGQSYVFHVDAFPDLDSVSEQLLAAACELTSQSATPTISPSPSQTPTISTTASPTASRSVTPSASPSPTSAQSPTTTPTASPSPSQKDEGGGGVDVGVIGGAAASGVLLVAVIAAVACKRSQKKNPLPPRMSVGASADADRPKSFYDVNLVVNPIFLRGQAKTQKRLAAAEGELTEAREQAEDANEALSRQSSRSALASTTQQAPGRTFWGRRTSKEHQEEIAASNDMLL